MSKLQQAKEKLAEMLTKVDINDPLSIELQTVYTLVVSAINEPISRDEANRVRANAMGDPLPPDPTHPPKP